MTDEQLIECAMAIKEMCEQKGKVLCRQCVFNNGYGICKLRDIPEVWKIERG